MRSILVLILLGILAVPAYATITIGVAPAFSTTLQNPSVALAGTTAGDGVVVAVFVTTTGVTISSVTISGESNATAIGSIAFNSTLIEGVQLFYLATLTGGGSKTITANCSAGANNSLYALTLHGADTATFYDSAQAGATGNSAAPATGAFTTNTNNDAIIVASVTANSDLTNAQGYTVGTAVNGNWFEDYEYKLDVGGAGSNNPTMAMTSGQWAIVAAAFKPAGGAAFTARASKRDKLRKVGVLP